MGELERSVRLRIRSFVLANGFRPKRLNLDIGGIKALKEEIKQTYGFCVECAPENTRYEGVLLVERIKND